MRLIDADKLTPLWMNNEDGLPITGAVLIDDILNAPTVDAIPVEWIKKYEKTDDLAASIYRMLEAWGVDMSDEGETV